MRENINQYDIIGDVHGRWDKLEPLLANLGYEHNGLCHTHPERRQVLFLGDLIDPKGDVPNGVREVLLAVKAMCDAGHARCILGNHELNFAAYHSRNPRNRDEYLKPHDKGGKGWKMHLGTHAALNEQEIEDVWLPWIKQLPFFIELPGLRVVHACWDEKSIEVLGGKNLEDDEFLRACVSKADEDREIYQAAEVTCKGVEIPMPVGESFHDHQGTERYKFRARWWKKGAKDIRARSLVFPASDDIPEKEVAASEVAKLPGYCKQAVPVFFGHYYKPSDSPLAPEAHNVSCIDHSAAIAGPLVAYRWNGEQAIQNEQFIKVSAQECAKPTVTDQIIKFLKTMPSLGYTDDEEDAWDTFRNSGGEVYFNEQFYNLYFTWVGHALNKLPEETLMKAWLVDTKQGREFLWSFQYDHDLDDNPDHTADDQPTWKDYEADLEVGSMPSGYLEELRAYAEDLKDDMELEKLGYYHEEDEDYENERDLGEITVDSQTEKALEIVPDIAKYQSFIEAVRSCSMIILENASYIQKALPTIQIESCHREKIQGLCDEFIGTKCDLFHEIMELEKLTTENYNEPKYRAKANLMILWLRELISTMHVTVSTLKQDPQATLAFILVAESGVNIMNAINTVEEAYEDLGR